MLKLIHNQWNHFSNWVSKRFALELDPRPSPSTSEPFEACYLPNEIEDYLADRLAQRPPPEPYLAAIQNALDGAMMHWISASTNSNCLLLVSSAADNLREILSTALDEWTCPLDSLTQWWLPWSARSADPQSLSADLLQVLNNQITVIQVASEQSPSRPLLIIPCLEQCFVRHPDGLEAIGQLVKTIKTHTEYFWLVGCNEWAWAYLNQVCELSAYFDHHCTLPSLDAAALKGWITQATDTMDVRFANPSKEEAERGSELVMGLTADQLDSYFHRLASLSEGLAPTAAQLWLRSLDVQEFHRDPESSPPPTASYRAPAAGSILTMGELSLPKLPSLHTADRYLLHAVLLHGAMTRQDLALSLADPIECIQPQLQSLFRTGLLQHQQGILRLHPIYYPQVKSVLRHNNFLLEVD